MNPTYLTYFIEIPIFPQMSNEISSKELLPLEESMNLNNPLSSISVELKHFLRAEWPGLLLAIDRHDVTQVKKYVCKLRKLNPSLKIDNFNSLILCLEQLRINRIHNLEIMSKNMYKNDERNALSRTGLPLIWCQLNGFEINGLIDTGAQLSIISYSLVEKCHILHLIDKRFQSKAIGVGEEKIIGKIHIMKLVINGYEMNISLMVVKTFHSNYILIGQDFLKEYKCIIDCSDGTITFREIGLSISCESV